MGTVLVDALEGDSIETCEVCDVRFVFKDLTTLKLPPPGCFVHIRQRQPRELENHGTFLLPFVCAVSS
jgi:hypothetical protein